jgi:2-polyprenyl-6-methoxyphenol hydroxylase-like FAD-dependent oxidoreductase
MTLATIPRYDYDRVKGTDQHAVVIGASMAGMLAARVLADRYSTVTVVDRDPLPDEAVARRGVPQSRQPHGLLEGGRATLEDLFPGYCEALVEAGGVVVDIATELEHYDEGEPLARDPAVTETPMYCATRPLFDFVVRQQLATVEGVELRGSCQFLDYLLDGDTVRGVRIRDEAGETGELAADLVVDATGRASRTPAWLEANGYPRPELDEVRIDLSYATVLLERPSDDRRTMLVPASYPDTRGAVIVPVEGDRWAVNLHGFHGDHPPSDVHGFRTFAADLSTPAVLELLDTHRLVDDEVHQYPIPSSRRYRYDELETFPGGLLVVGDAIASFNPIYAQGITVAALEALSLHHVLADGDDALAERFFDRAASVVNLAWSLSVGPDFAFPETEGVHPGGNALVERYMARLLRRAHYDPKLTDTFGRVIGFEQPPTSLFRPAVLWRVLSPVASARGRSEDLPDPTASGHAKE